MSGEDREAEVIRSESPVGYSYATIRLTQSRIDKGLIAVPIALAKWFPDHNTDIGMYLDNSGVLQSKRYSSLNSSTKECRIGGVRQWFKDNNLESGDEIVVQLLDKENRVYRLLAERDFLANTRQLQSDLDGSASELEASEKLSSLAEWTNREKAKAALIEYRRLVATCDPAERRIARRRLSRSGESTPANLRVLLGQLHHGHCQICDFWFLKQNGEPYFEIHHLDAQRGHHPKNLVLVCGNCHNQFEHAEVVPEFNDERWLIKVRFNRILHPVKQITMPTQMSDFCKELFV